MTKIFLKNDPNFKECIEVLNKLKIDYWVCHGTLLGIMRDKSLIPWDNDIDIGSWDLKNKEKIILYQMLLLLGLELKCNNLCRTCNSNHGNTEQ